MPAMPSNQELFEKGLATYRKVEAANYVAYREVYGLLHDVLVADAPEGFVFADLGCGSATGSAKALAGTKIGRYVGVDISGRSLDVAREALRDPMAREAGFAQAEELLTVPNKLARVYRFHL
jgi:ubiquinone/menaquinone biosynthesis C-methylase UbiE